MGGMARKVQATPDRLTGFDHFGKVPAVGLGVP